MSRIGLMLFLYQLKILFRLIRDIVSGEAGIQACPAPVYIGVVPCVVFRRFIAREGALDEHMPEYKPGRDALAPEHRGRE